MQLEKGTHNGVVLHGTDQHMVSRVKKPLDDHVQPGRVARGQQHMGGFFRKGKELLKLLP